MLALAYLYRTDALPPRVYRTIGRRGVRARVGPAPVAAVDVVPDKEEEHAGDEATGGRDGGAAETPVMEVATAPPPADGQATAQLPTADEVLVRQALRPCFLATPSRHQHGTQSVELPTLTQTRVALCGNSSLNSRHLMRRVLTRRRSCGASSKC